MSESFADLLDESIASLEMQPGSIVSGVVLDIDKNWVTVHVGLKSEGVISIDEFRTNDGQLNICLLYTSPSPRDKTVSRMPSSA